MVFHSISYHASNCYRMSRKSTACFQFSQLDLKTWRSSFSLVYLFMCAWSPLQFFICILSMYLAVCCIFETPLRGIRSIEWIFNTCLGSVRGRPPSWVIALRSYAIIRGANLITSRGGPVILDDETSLVAKLIVCHGCIKEHEQTTQHM